MVGKKHFVLGLPEQQSQDKSLLYRHDEPNEPIREGTLPFVLFESPFTSVSTVSRSHPSLVSLVPGDCLKLEILLFTKQPVQVCPVRIKASKRAEIKEI